MDARRLRWEEWLAGLSGAVLFASLFLPWYRSEVNQVDYTAWQSFGSLDVLLAAVGLIGVALVIVTAVHPTAAVPIAMASLLALSGLLATALTISRIVTPPGFDTSVIALGQGGQPHGSSGVTIAYGAWIGLGGVAVATLSALAAMRDDSYPKAVVEASRRDIETRPAPPVDRGAEGPA